MAGEEERPGLRVAAGEERPGDRGGLEERPLRGGCIIRDRREGSCAALLPLLLLLPGRSLTYVVVIW